MHFPMKFFKKLFHVGTLDPANKKRHSYEGSGLSVTTHPHEWCRITPLAGSIHVLTKTDNQFLHFHKLNKSQKDEIKAWGLKEGYIEEVEMYRATYYDDEFEMDLYSDYESREEAEWDYEGCDIKMIKTIRSTSKMDQRTMNDKSVSGRAMDLLTTLYVEDVLDIDGVWWQDKLDVPRYSAPRGVISVHKLSKWNIQVQGE